MLKLRKRSTQSGKKSSTPTKPLLTQKKQDSACSSNNTVQNKAFRTKSCVLRPKLHLIYDSLIWVTIINLKLLSQKV